MQRALALCSAAPATPPLSQLSLALYSGATAPQLPTAEHTTLSRRCTLHAGVRASWLTAWRHSAGYRQEDGQLVRCCGKRGVPSGAPGEAEPRRHSEKQLIAGTRAALPCCPYKKDLAAVPPCVCSGGASRQLARRAALPRAQPWRRWQIPRVWRRRMTPPPPRTLAGVTLSARIESPHSQYATPPLLAAGQAAARASLRAEQTLAAAVVAANLPGSSISRFLA